MAKRGPEMSIKVMIAFSNILFSEGVKMLLEDDGSENFKVEDVLKVGSSPYEMIEALKPDVILIDLITLYNEFKEAGPKSEMKLILFDSGCGPDNIASAITAKGLSGVLAGNTDPPLLKRAIRAVAEGGEWLDQGSFNNLPAFKMEDNVSEKARAQGRT
jgi:DNA-binding NarL/FixJ family response regulator